MNKRRHFILLLMAILVAGFALRVAYFTWAPKDYAAADSDYDDIAQNLAAGKGFSLDKPVPGRNSGEPSREVRTVPVASRTPAYPFFLAAVYKLFGRRLKLVYLIQTVIDMLSALLLYFLTLRIAGSERVALVATLIYALYMPFMSQTAVLLNETLFGFLLLGFTLVSVRALEHPSFANFLASGALLGAVTLCRPTTFLFPVVLLAAVLIRYRGVIGQLVVPSVAFVAGFVALVAPWVVRNYVVLDYVGLVGSLAGEQVYAANYIWHRPNTPEPMVPDDLRAKLAGKSDIERNKILMREGFRQILLHPVNFAKNVLYRTSTFWTAIGMGGPAFFYFSSGRAGKEMCVFVVVVNIALIIASVIAFVMFRGPWTKASFVPLLLLGYFYIIHLPIIALVRYSMPVIPFLMMFAAVAIVNLFGKARTAAS